MLEGDDDAVSLLQEKEIDNLAGKMHTHTRVHTQSHTCAQAFTHAQTQRRIKRLRLLFLVPFRPRLFTSKGKCGICGTCDVLQMN